MMLGTIPAPPALADMAALLRIISDPKAAKANLDALAEAAAALEALRAELEAREKAVGEQAAINETIAAKIEADQKAIDNAAAGRVRVQEAIVAARKALAADKDDHVQRVAALRIREQEVGDRAAQLEQDNADLQKRADKLAADADARSKALDDRQDAIEKGEADLRAKVADWQRVTKALQGA